MRQQKAVVGGDSGGCCVNSRLSELRKNLTKNTDKRRKEEINVSSFLRLLISKFNTLHYLKA
ncbi:hypothetical protein V7068_11760 [Bacillus sp. JJ634]